MQIRPGDIVKTASLNSKFFDVGESKPFLTASFSAGRGNHFLCLFLGAAKDGTTIEPEALLHSLGWLFDPDKANAILAEKINETV